MTKAEIVASISKKIGVEKVDVQAVIEAFMKEVKDSICSEEDVFLRGFGSFKIKERAEKTGRNISKNTTIIIPAHKVPVFKPSKAFVNQVKDKTAGK
ncbi:MAG: HU family DNA-binding protein [Flavobacteriales bacterium]